jgi:hypothetical protein
LVKLSGLPLISLDSEQNFERLHLKKEEFYLKINLVGTILVFFFGKVVVAPSL